MILTDLLTAYILISASTATILFALYKWGVMDYYEVYRPQWMPERCEPCFSLWIGTLLSGVAILVVGVNILVTILAIPPLAIFFYRLLRA